MTAMKLKRWIGRVKSKRLGALLGAVAGAAGVALFISSCYTRTEQRRPLHVGGVPDIRVRVLWPPARTVTISTSGPCTIRPGALAPAFRSEALNAEPVSRRAGTWRLARYRAAGHTIEIVPQEGGRVTLEGVEYRGRVRLIASGDGFYAVNTVDIESYLAGVLPKELYSHWSDQTFHAQAIAARTFAMHKIETFGTEAGRTYDLTSTQGSQVYGGQSAETDKAWRAVRGTHGKVLAYGLPGGELKLILAHYSSCCGGTVNTARVLRAADDIPPLRGGQRCHDCRASSRYVWPPVTVAKKELYRCLALSYREVAALGALAKIRVLTRTAYGLPIWCELVGPSGRTARVRYNDIRAALQRGRSPAARKLHSMNCRMKDRRAAIEFYDGHGFGHGVGLCQWGAQGKAQRGWSASRILRFYYPGITIHQAY